MTRARRELISLEDTPYYHVINRCVRRAFLCGYDGHSGQNYEHRRQWVVDKMKALGQVFCIDICAYAIMSNHFHLVLYVNQERAKELTRDEVIDLWLKLFKGPSVVARYLNSETLLDVEMDLLDRYVAQWRERLMDISWFMRCLNEKIARQANIEDDCKGRFWEGRFKSQALLDTAALLTCMAYVDLNPVRAGMSKTPETSDFTSIQERLFSHATKQGKSKQPSTLKRFSTNTLKDPKRISFKLDDYFQLVDWTGRILRADKRGSIPEDYPPILQRLQLLPDKWLEHMQGSQTEKGIALGRLEKVKTYIKNCGFKWLRGTRYNRELFGI
jgi:REP element-mobilizing transposase RayT